MRGAEQLRLRRANPFRCTSMCRSIILNHKLASVTWPRPNMIPGMHPESRNRRSCGYNYIELIQRSIDRDGHMRAWMHACSSAHAILSKVHAWRMLHEFNATRHASPRIVRRLKTTVYELKTVTHWHGHLGMCLVGWIKWMRWNNIWWIGLYGSSLQVIGWRVLLREGVLQ